MINVKALQKVSLWLKRLRHPKHFDLESWVDTNECGTSWCIAGRALFDAGLLEYDKDYTKRAEYHHPVTGKLTTPFSASRTLLGLTVKQAKSLFYGDHYAPKEAAAHIDKFLMEEAHVD